MDNFASRLKLDYPDTCESRFCFCIVSKFTFEVTSKVSRPSNHHTCACKIIFFHRKCKFDQHIKQWVLSKPCWHDFYYLSGIPSRMYAHTPTWFRAPCSLCAALESSLVAPNCVGSWGRSQSLQSSRTIPTWFEKLRYSCGQSTVSNSSVAIPNSNLRLSFNEPILQPLKLWFDWKEVGSRVLPRWFFCTGLLTDMQITNSLIDFSEVHLDLNWARKLPLQRFAPATESVFWIELLEHISCFCHVVGSDLRIVLYVHKLRSEWKGTKQSEWIVRHAKLAIYLKVFTQCICLHLHGRSCKKRISFCLFEALECH